MLCSQDIEIEKIQLRIEIFQKELTTCFSVLRKLHEKDNIANPEVIHLFCERVEKLKLEFSEIEERFQTYKRRFTDQ